MSLPIIVLTIDKDKPGGVNALIDAAASGAVWDPDTGSRSATSVGVSWMALDTFELQIQFIDTEAETEEFNFDAGCTVSVSLCLLTELDDSGTVPELVRVTPFSLVSTYYKADVALDTTDVANAIDEDLSLACALDIRVETATLRLTYRVPVTLYRPVLGTAPAGGSVGSTWANVAGAQMRQRADGLIEFYDFTRAKWVTPVVRDGVLEFQEDA